VPLSRKRDVVPVYQPPSAVDKTMDGPLPAPPTFTTSTSIPKPAIPARERSNSSRAQTNERTGLPFKSDEQRAKRRSHTPQTYALASSPATGELDSGHSGTAFGSSQPSARLVIERGGRVGKEFPIVGVETNIGRWDADSGIFPDVDLDEDDAEAKVSRRHARIVNHNSQYFIEDLGSTNGTFVNRGRRLLPGKRHVLQNGDEIIVGKTFLKFQILK
jgi:hypothetical protein